MYSVNIICHIIAGISIEQIAVTMIILMVIAALLVFYEYCKRRLNKQAKQSQELAAIMQRTLDITSNYVLRLDLRKKTAYNLNGNLLPDEGMTYQESFALIHPEDHHIYRTFAQRMSNGEAETDECIFRWDMSGKQGLGHWRYLHDQGVIEYGNGRAQKPTNLFCTLTDITDSMEEEKAEQTMNSKYRMMFEQSIVGLAFYDKDGNLLTANRKMREILNFQGEDDTYYYGHTLYDLPTFLNLLNHRQVEDLYFCTKSVLAERGVNCYTELRVHPICDNEGALTYITFSIRDITQERELYLQNRRNAEEIRRANEAMQEYEMELQYLMDTCDMRFFRIKLPERKCTFYKRLSAPEFTMDFNELIAHFIDSPFRQGLQDYENYFCVPRRDLTHMHPFFHESEELQWNFIDSVPYFDEEGRMLGTYGIVRNVNDLIQKQERLKQETERANDSGRLKSVFMANMTHEIRTPLNSIVGFSDVLPLLTDTEEKQEIIHVITKNCDMLLRLINDLLAIASVDTGGIQIVPSKTDFAKAFDDMFESLRDRVQVADVAFIANNPYQHFVALLDITRIQQVVTNFVINAVKYTRQGHIRLGYRQEERTIGDKQQNGLYIYCEDTGEGVPKEAQDKIFDRFVKLNDYVQGTGLGLSICKAIANAYQGLTGVDSEGKDCGSTFWLWLPCEPIETEPATS